MVAIAEVEGWRWAEFREKRVRPTRLAQRHAYRAGKAAVRALLYASPERNGHCLVPAADPEERALQLPKSATPKQTQ